MSKKQFVQTEAVKEASKALVPGTWITVDWLDIGPQEVIFCGYTGGSRKDGNYKSTYKGPRGIIVLEPGVGLNSNAEHTQIIMIHGTIIA